MKIALLGYGRMGKAIEATAIKRNHSIVLKANSKEQATEFDADVAIDFSTPKTAFNNIENALRQNIPVISGTTGWLENYNKILDVVEETNGAFLYASNFSLGVNLYFELNNHLAKIMTNLTDYKPSIEEIHHTNKLDAPSGTAITLANTVMAHHSGYKNWALEFDAKDNEIAITSKRIEDVPGTHEVKYSSVVDEISIKHEAFSREGFALGAVIASEWIVGKKGVFTMKEVLSIN